jgi:hypothetical protein
MKVIEVGVLGAKNVLHFAQGGEFQCRNKNLALI